MINNLSGNKRIAANTMVLYGKLIISIVISFLVSRLVLDALGASDYGLYNVVGGIVSLLNTLGITMIATSYRFLAVEIGKGDNGNPNRVYNTILIIHIALAIFLLLIGETIGVYYVNNYLNVETERISDALFVLHLSLITSAIAVLTIPVNGLIIAREKFLFTAIVEIVSAIMKLVFILLLMQLDGNKLRIYACMLAVCQLVGPVAFQIYCRITDRTVIKWSLNRNREDYGVVVKFASGILLGSMACMARVQGAAMIINYYFGTVLNAAFGLATQVWTASDQFTNSLRQAAIPQIMKSHSSGDKGRSLDIVYLISRYSFLLMLLPAVPLITGIDGVLKLWLGVPPEYTDSFIVLLMISGLVGSLGAGFDAEIQATGKIWKNQIGFSLINLSLLPIMFLMYKAGMPPYSNAIAMVFLSLAVVVFQAYIMRELTGFNLKRYLIENVKPCVITAMISLLPFFLLRTLVSVDFKCSLWPALLSLLWTLVVVYVTGTNKKEKRMVISFVSSKINDKLIKKIKVF